MGEGIGYRPESAARDRTEAEIASMDIFAKLIAAERIRKATKDRVTRKQQRAILLGLTAALLENVSIRGNTITIGNMHHDRLAGAFRRIAQQDPEGARLAYRTLLAVEDMTPIITRVLLRLPIRGPIVPRPPR